MSSNIPDKITIKEYTIKLLEKANKHPKLTPRLLRAKLEQKLKLPNNSLDVKKSYIKKIAITWWMNDTSDNVKVEIKEEKTKEIDQNTIILQKLNKIVHIVGKTLVINKAIKNLADDEKITYIREKLRESGLIFSDIPTNEEITKIKADREKEKALEDIDTSLVIDKPRNNKKDEVVENNNNNNLNRKRKIIYDDDEEAEFE